MIINFRCRDSALIAKLLVKKGVDVNQPDYKGRTALHFAASKGHTSLASILLEHGANIESLVRFYTESQNKLITSSERRSLKSTQIHSTNILGVKKITLLIVNNSKSLKVNLLIFTVMIAE